MPILKQPLDPNRIRSLPEQGFSWIDRRFVRDGWIDSLEPEPVLLYFFLVAVGDAQGLSFYADRTLTRMLGLDFQELSQARARLLQAELILYRHPLYQVLPLPPAPPEKPKLRKQRRAPTQLMSLGEILREAWSRARPRSLPTDNTATTDRSLK